MKNIRITAAVVLLVIIPLWLGKTRGYAALTEQDVIKMNLIEQLNPIETVSSQDYSSQVQAYFAYYGLDFEKNRPQVEHYFGTFVSGDFKLAAHLYDNKDSSAAVILLHGYLNHTGQFKYLIGWLLDNGFSVAVYDLPGHGLSTGERASIGDFSQYTDSMVDFYNVVASRFRGPYHAAGFSTGASVIVDYYLENKDECDFGKVILAGPLVRNVAWKASKTALKFYNNFADSVQRTHRKNSSNREFLDFNKNKDVLHCEKVPLKWVKSLHEWNDKIADLGPSNKEIHIIQGDKDTTVSFRYNLRFLEKKFPSCSIKMINGGRHELFNESESIRQEVFGDLITMLG